MLKVLKGGGNPNAHTQAINELVKSAELIMENIQMLKCASTEEIISILEIMTGVCEDNIQNLIKAKQRESLRFTVITPKRILK